MVSVVSVVLFYPSFNVWGGYFYISLGFKGHFVIPNLAEFRDTATLGQNGDFGEGVGGQLNGNLNWSKFNCRRFYKINVTTNDHWLQKWECKPTKVTL